MKIKSKKLTRKSIRNPYDLNQELTKVTLNKINETIFRLKDELKKDNGGYYSSNVVSIKVLNFIKAEMLNKDEDGDSNFPNHWTYDLVGNLNSVFSSISESGYMDRNY